MLLYAPVALMAVIHKTAVHIVDSLFIAVLIVGGLYLVSVLALHL